MGSLSGFMMAWDEKQLHWHLTTRRFGRQFQYFDEIDSTNRWLIEHPETFTLTGAVAIAGHQTAGRGRHLRSWLDSSGSGLLCSVMLRLRTKHMAKGFLSMIPAIALARSIMKHDSAAEVALKWPNDVLLSHKKVAGILAESTLHAGVEIVVVGIGINVNSIPGNDFIWPATSLRENSKWHPNREILLAELLNHWEPLFDQFLDNDFDGLRVAWEEFGPQKGARMKRVELPNIIEGEFEGLGENGQLLLRDAEGMIQEVYSGDVLPE
ncbi:MAG: biotin--[acetyl-CoA-carboxylase] ligase [bacterium]|nr:biotin--[acetyl-CoA-carboxylase] ligase [bacterium]